MNKTLPAIVLLVVLVAIGIGAVALSNKNTVPPVTVNVPPVMSVPPQATTTGTEVSRRATLRGKMVCLPHKNANGPQTMECTFGMLADNGSYYALDWSVVDPSGTFNLPMDKTYSVTGLLTPIEAISNDFWKRYNVRGIMKVEKYSGIGADII